MLLFFVRHGDPVYVPDSLTPLGRRQAEAVAKRLARYGLDKIYVSSSARAIQTSEPTCEMLKMQSTVLDWCNESHAWAELAFSAKRRRIPVGLPTRKLPQAACFSRNLCARRSLV